jgi:hypothetical protein
LREEHLLQFHAREYRFQSGVHDKIQSMRHVALAISLFAACTSHARAAQWFNLSGRDSAPGATVVEVNLESVHRHEGGADAVIRVTHDVLHAHPGGFGYRSFVATSSIDCAKRTIMLVSAAYFASAAGQGIRVGADSTGRANGMTLAAEKIPQQARQALLRAACTSTP